MLPFAPGIVGYCTEQVDELSLELRSLRKPKNKTFTIKDSTIINTIKSEFSPILEDYLGDSLPGFSDTFFEMMECPIPDTGEEREFEIFNGVKMKFCWIPAGEAQLGSTEEERDCATRTLLEGHHPEWLENEAESIRGIHKSNGFWLGKYEVTQSQWESVMGNNPSNFKGESLPVDTVSWEDCHDFIKQCSALELKPQLPHEDQWEYACRGGKGNKQPFYWGNELNGSQANCNGNLPYGTDKKGNWLRRTTEVGSYEKIAPHPWNLCDMHGNVWEWCDNFYNNYPFRVSRGGGWGSFSWNCRSSFRFGNDPTFRYLYLGFRLIIC